MLIEYPDFIDKNNIIINIDKQTIKVKKGGYVDEDGISVQALYLYLKEEWKVHPELIKYEFPLEAIAKDLFINASLWYIIPNNIKDGMIFPNNVSFGHYQNGKYEKFKKELMKDIRRKKLRQIDEKK